MAFKTKNENAEFQLSIYRKSIDYWVMDFRCKNYEVDGDDISLIFVAHNEPQAITCHIENISGWKEYTKYFSGKTYKNFCTCTDEKLLAMPVGNKWVL